MKYFKYIGWTDEEHFNPWEAHHFYWGFVIAFVGFVCLFQLSISIWLSAFFMILGLWILVDDVIQHYVQRKEIKEYGRYRSVSFWNWWPEGMLVKWKSFWSSLSKS